VLCRIRIKRLDRIGSITLGRNGHFERAKGHVVIPDLGAGMNQQEQFVSVMMMMMMMMMMMTMMTTKVTEMTKTVSTIMAKNDCNIFRYTPH